MGLFARWRNLLSSTVAWTESAKSKRATPSARSARRRAQAQAEVLDRRVLLTTTGHAAASAATADLADRVAAVVKPYLDNNDFPGISVTVVKHGHVVLAQGYGRSDVATGAPVAANTEFDIGSVTKTFTAVAVLLLYQESQGTSHPLNLDAPISDYLYDNKSFKLPRKWDHITTRELLAMTSGIRDMGGPEPWQAQVDSIANDRLLYTPGTKSSYSNVDYYLLGELIQQWTGEDYSTFIQDQILNPLGMSQTSVLGRNSLVPNQAVAYSPGKHGRWEKIHPQNGTEMFAAAGMVSTAQDMGTYMTALLSGQILDPATYAMMWTSDPVPQYGVKPASSELRGLGWDTVTDMGSRSAEVTKSGQVPGFSSELILFPSTDSGIYVSFNTDYPNGHHAPVTADQVAEAIYQATKPKKTATG